MPLPEAAVHRVQVVHVDAAGDAHARQDCVAVEAPLEVWVGQEMVATTMRTPGHDEELAAGLLWAEGIVTAPDDLLALVAHAPDPGAGPLAAAVARATLAVPPPPALAQAKRGTLTSAACGVCGRQTLEDLLPAPGAQPSAALHLNVRTLAALPAALRRAQAAFDVTGGLHAAGVTDANGQMLVVREDVGRHNAVDKAVGRLVLDRRIHAAACLVVSGRTSFEIVQKAIRARIAAVIGVSAPSSLAVALAERHGVLLLGFARAGACNVYSSHKHDAGL